MCFYFTIVFVTLSNNMLQENNIRSNLKIKIKMPDYYAEEESIKSGD